MAILGRNVWLEPYKGSHGFLRSEVHRKSTFHNLSLVYRFLNCIYFGAFRLQGARQLYQIGSFSMRGVVQHLELVMLQLPKSTITGEPVRIPSS
eukprot:scaffold353_cov185-Amphora_coffeaeformis.AAC.86